MTGFVVQGHNLSFWFIKKKKKKKKVEYESQR